MSNKKKDYQIWTDKNTWADVLARFNKKKQKKNHSNKYILIAILFAFVGLIVILDSGIKLKEVHFERTIKEVELHNLNLKMNERLKMGVREEIIHLAGISMLITAYSEFDSCHYEDCKMASGKSAYVGAIACPRNWELGKQVIIDGKTYTCEDRYNLNLEDRIDIFMGYGEENYLKAVSYGKQIKEIYLLDKK